MYSHIRTMHVNQHFCKRASVSQLANLQLQSFGQMFWNQWGDGWNLKLAELARQLHLCMISDSGPQNQRSQGQNEVNKNKKTNPHLSSFLPNTFLTLSSHLPLHWPSSFITLSPSPLHTSLLSYLLTSSLLSSPLPRRSWSSPPSNSAAYLSIQVPQSCMIPVTLQPSWESWVSAADRWQRKSWLEGMKEGGRLRGWQRERRRGRKCCRGMLRKRENEEEKRKCNEVQKRGQR